MEDDFSVEVAVGELREEVRALAAQFGDLSGRIEGLVAMLESKEAEE